MGDFNGDGQQDLAVAISSNGVSILLGDGAGGFSTAPSFGLGVGRLSIALGDFNGDGQQDLATANTNAGIPGSTVSVFLRQCPPSFSIDNVTRLEGNSGTTPFVFTVTKTGNTTLSTFVDFVTRDGTATLADNDYQFNSGTLKFTAAATTAQITVLVNGDTNVEPDETFTVHLSNAINATISVADGTGTILDDDASPTPTPTATATATPIATATPTVAPTPTPSATPTATATATATPRPTATPTATATSTPTATPPSGDNLSTRGRVETGDNVVIGGFIITGNAPRKTIVRAIGPSLIASGITDALADPTLELRASDGSLIRANDNWKDTQQAEIEATGIPPQNDLESAIVATLPPGSYTAILRGKSQGTGVALLEIYDLDRSTDSKLANISTRAFCADGKQRAHRRFYARWGQWPKECHRARHRTVADASRPHQCPGRSHPGVARRQRDYYCLERQLER